MIFYRVSYAAFLSASTSAWPHSKDSSLNFRKGTLRLRDVSSMH